MLSALVPRHASPPQDVKRRPSAYGATDPRGIVAAQESGQIRQFFHGPQPAAGDSVDHVLLKCSHGVETAKGTLRNWEHRLHFTNAISLPFKKQIGIKWTLLWQPVHTSGFVSSREFHQILPFSSKQVILPKTSLKKNHSKCNLSTLVSSSVTSG